MLGFFAF